MSFETYNIAKWNYKIISSNTSDYNKELIKVLKLVIEKINEMYTDISFYDNAAYNRFEIKIKYTDYYQNEVSKCLCIIPTNTQNNKFHIETETEFSGVKLIYNKNNVGPGCHSVNAKQEINTISEIMISSNCIAFSFRNSYNYNSLHSKYQLVLSRTKKGSWAIITPIATPFKQEYFKHDQNISINSAPPVKNNIVCYSPLTNDTDLMFNFTPVDLGKQSSIMSFDPIPVLGTDDYCLGCYFNFYSNLASPGFIVVDGKRFYYNGWMSIEE